MNPLSELKKYYRFGFGLRKFVGEKISLEDSLKAVRYRMERREEFFLNLIQKVIYENPKSPYLGMLDAAGFGLSDLKRLVSRSGIEQSLHELAENGVYLTFDEFKGNKNVIRNGRTFYFEEQDFDNPYLSSYFHVKTGATSGVGTRTMIDFDFLRQEAINRSLLLDCFGLMDVPCILWFPILPGNAGIMNVFRQAKIGSPPIKWFSQVDNRGVKQSMKDRMGTDFTVYAGRIFGCRIPGPEYVNLTEAHKIAEYVFQVIKSYSKCCVWTYAGSAVRVCASAKEMNLDLNGATFFVSGEPLTKTKFSEIASSGAKAVPYFAFVEGGITACGCVNSSGPDDMHIMKDRMAVISHEKRSQNSSDVLNALLFTSLLPEAPKILLNVETGDHACLEPKQCGCPFESYGFSEHLSMVRSFEKFTNEGMTFSVNELIRVIEEVLPERFGGSSTDYQVQRTATEDDLSNLYIVASPRIGEIDEERLLATVIRELGKGEGSKRLMAEIWSSSGALKVKRAEPVPTKRGKLFPIHIVDKGPLSSNFYQNNKI